MRQGFARKLAMGSMGLVVALLMSFGLYGCGNKEEAKEPKQSTEAAQPAQKGDANSPAPTNTQAQEGVDVSAVDPNAKTALENVESGAPSTTAPKINEKGSSHKGETLFFIVAAEYNSKEDAEQALKDLNAKIEAAGQKEYFAVIPSDTIAGFDAGKFLVAEAYPSQEAIDGYNALEFTKKVAPEGAQPYVKAGTFNSDQKIVVFGVDVQ